MNPRTLCACQPVAFMIWASVAPPLRWSRPRTVAFLLPSRAAAGLLPALARFPLAALAGFAFAAGLAFFPFFAAALAWLAPFGAAVAVSAGLPPSRLWMAFQILLTADLRSVNFLTGVRPGMPFQTSISRSAGHSATRLANSCWVLKLSPSPASCLVGNAVMLFSVSIVYVFISLFPLCRLLRSWHSSLWSAEEASQFCGLGEKNLGRAIRRAACGPDGRGRGLGR